MGVRILCVILLAFTISMWGAIPDMKYLSDTTKVGAHLFYAAGCLAFIYGIITGRAPL